MSVSRRDFIKSVMLGVTTLILPVSLPKSETLCSTLDAFIPENWITASIDILKENMVIANIVHRDFEKCQNRTNQGVTFLRQRH